MTENGRWSTRTSPGRTRPPTIRPLWDETESERLHEDLVAAIAGRGRLILIGGAAGIGKTTLVRNLVREARAGEMSVLVGHCYDLTNTPPYGPWLDLVAGYRPSGTMPLLPAAFADGRLEGITSQAALFAEVRHFFAAVAKVHRTFVVLEDLHWADPASLELLRHIAGDVEDIPMLVVATYRVDELTRRHPLLPTAPRADSGGAQVAPRPAAAGAGRLP